MNRPTRITFFGFGLIMLFILFAVATGHPQEGTSPVRRVYDDCVNQSVAAQLVQLPFNRRKLADHNMMIEEAFLACRTEEQALWLLLSTINAQRAPMLVMAVKIQVKRQILAVITNPSAYLPAK